jgi:hypothetical protein
LEFGTGYGANDVDLQAKLFISYRRDDSAAMAGRLYDRFKRRNGPVFFDADTIRAGRDFPTALRQALRQCRVFLVVIGNHWLAVEKDGFCRLENPKDFVRIEVAAALRRPQKEIEVIPILISPATMPKPEQLPKPLRRLTRLQAIEIDTKRDFAGEIKKLIAELDSQLGYRAYKPHVSRPNVGRQSKPSRRQKSKRIFRRADLVGGWDAEFVSETITFYFQDGDPQKVEGPWEAKSNVGIGPRGFITRFSGDYSVKDNMLSIVETHYRPLVRSLPIRDRSTWLRSRIISATSDRIVLANGLTLTAI